MKINKDILSKIAHLARLELDEKEEERMIKDLTEIVTFVEKLNEVNTDGIEPLTTMSSEVNVMREDEVQEHLSHERALRYAPKADSGYFRVPKVLE